MTDTLPPELTRRIIAETAAAMSKADDEREFRERVLEDVTEIRVTMQHLVERLQKHEEDDRQNFRQVNQSIGGALSLKQIGWTLAGITATVAVFWGALEIVKHFARVSA